MKLSVQFGGMHAAPYLKTVELTVAPFGLTVPFTVALLMPMLVAAPVSDVGASWVVNCCSLPQLGVVSTEFVAQSR